MTGKYETRLQSQNQYDNICDLYTWFGMLSYKDVKGWKTDSVHILLSVLTMSSGTIQDSHCARCSRNLRQKSILRSHITKICSLFESFSKVFCGSNCVIYRILVVSKVNLMMKPYILFTVMFFRIMMVSDLAAVMRQRADACKSSHKI